MSGQTADARIVELEAQLVYERSMKEQFSAQADKLTETVELLSARSADYLRQLHEYEAETIRLETENRNVRNAQIELEARLAEANGRFQSERQHAEWLQSECNKAVDAMETANSRAEQVEARAEEYNQRLIALSAQWHESEMARVVAEAQLAWANQRAEDADADLVQAIRERATAIQHGAAAEARAQEANARIIELEASASEHRGELAELRIKHRTLMERADQRAETAEAREAKLRGIAEKLWEKVNDWRCRLIQWEAAGDASERDLVELAELQALADEYISTVAPLPIAELKQHMRERGIEIPAQDALQPAGNITPVHCGNCAKLRTALGAVEWVCDASHSPNAECPWCRNLEYDGHKPDCPRQEALQPAPDTKQLSTVGDALVLVNEATQEEIRQCAPGESLNEYRKRMALQPALESGTE